jgi:hypothetical protein
MYSRRPVGWSLQLHRDQQVLLDARGRASSRRLEASRWRLIV